MASFKTRLAVVVVILGITAFLTISIRVMARAHPANAMPLNELPLVIGNYTGREIPVEQSAIEILETPNVIMREYTGPGGVDIVAAIVYYPQYRVYFHMPEGCMVGRGSVIVAEEKEAIDISSGGTSSLTANKLVLKQRDRDEHVFYFFVSGDLMTPSYPAVRFHLMMEHLRGRSAGAALVRFSTHVNEDNRVQNVDVLKGFIREICPLLPVYLK
ncbi:MAG: EpsI family protein [Candidatus Abyssobacteria bacterium SURF_17]|jgi:EpsI family protein|uniref:EpsI family protein n=1 Tax=Candidatus Abyssobacteria bacterium SURF_17 TaxID=2093361 RepID=A0A419F983_9BACT|nr:MAG: EpsI family protein [Candidatus Abyssubacteria bacterium SURF_17]